MGLFDNALPSGGLTKPIMIAVGALLLKKMLSHDTPPDQTPVGHAQNAPQPSFDDSSVIGGLGDLVNKFRNSGMGSTIDSWIGAGANAPVEPAQLGHAIGQTTISDIARQAGMSEQELLAQLSQVLPGLIDKLTPNGRLPNPADYGRRA